MSEFEAFHGAVNDAVAKGITQALKDADWSAFAAPLYSEFMKETRRLAAEASYVNAFLSDGDGCAFVAYVPIGSDDAIDAKRFLLSDLLLEDHGYYIEFAERSIAIAKEKLAAKETGK